MSRIYRGIRPWWIRSSSARSGIYYLWCFRATTRLICVYTYTRGVGTMTVNVAHFFFFLSFSRMDVWKIICHTHRGRSAKGCAPLRLHGNNTYTHGMTQKTITATRCEQSSPSAALESRACNIIIYYSSKPQRIAKCTCTQRTYYTTCTREIRYL